MAAPASAARDAQSRSAKGRTEISLSLKAVDDLFVSFDPSPLVGRDIDNAIEEFVVETVVDAPRGRAIALALHLPADEAQGANAAVIAEAFRNYFGFMRAREEGRIRRLWRDGRASLAVGLVFLAVCIAAGQAAVAVAPGPVGSFVEQSLMILGWVANWKPVEIFLYEWRPMKRLLDVYDELSRLEVSVRAA